jgi:hypothetical protein
MRTFRYVLALKRSGTLLRAFALAMLCVPGSQAAERDTLQLLVDDRRPLAKALLDLSVKYGYVITYEDPRLAYQGDITDVTQEVRREPGRPALHTAPAVVVPYGGILRVRYEVERGSGRPPDAEALILAVLDAQRETGNGGIFRFVRSGDVFHVIPEQVRDEKGEWVEQASVLEIPVSIPERKRDGLQMLDAICHAITQRAGVKIAVGSVPLGRFVRPHGISGAKNESARDVLVRTLGTTEGKLTWQIFYAPDLKEYFLNVLVLEDELAPSRTERSPPHSRDPRLRRPTDQE